MADLQPLDDRIMAMVDRMKKSGRDDLAFDLASSAAYLREAWRGADVQADLAEDLQAVRDATQSALQTVLTYTDRI